MAMTVRELIDILEGFDGDMEVRIAEQPNWPFEYSIAGIAEFNPNEDDWDDEDEEENNKSFVYIVEGRQLGYISNTLWDIC